MNNSLQRRNQASVSEFEEPVAPQAPVGAVSFLSAEKEAKQMEIAMITAKRFPRDYTEVEMKVEKACTRERLAAAAEYSFPRAGETITGASVRLMEVIAQCYGNVEFGVSEIQRYADYSEGEAFAWDFENNIRVSRRFTVPHYRDTKGGRKRVTEDRDIREVVFNYGSRNMRACIERVIPRDLVDLALEKCRETLNGDSKGLADRIKKCKKAFEAYEIDALLLERIIGEKCDRWNAGHLRLAIQYFNALKDGETTKQALVEGVVKTIGKAQIDELSGIIGTNQARIDALKALGYELGEIKNIPAVDYDKIKTTISNIQGGGAPQKGGQKTGKKGSAPEPKEAEDEAGDEEAEEFDEDSFFGDGDKE